MKVYVLTVHYDSDTGQTFGVFDKPKTVRKWVDEKSGLNTKNKWKKYDGGMRRYYFRPGCYYQCEEFKFIKEKL